MVPITHWNNAAAAVRTTPLGLNNQAGDPTAATVTWTANGVWATPIVDQPGNARLMKGYLDTSTTSTTTVTVAGLRQALTTSTCISTATTTSSREPASTPLAPSGGTATTIKATDVAYVNFSGSFTRAADSNGNYVKFTIVGGGFTLTASPGVSTNTTRRAPVNAIEIVPQ